MHPLFIILLILSAITGHVLELLTLFSIVIVHEMGHVVAARWCGWSIEDVKLLPFGGVAETKDGAVSPAWQECLVAAAGPLQNGLLIAFAYGMNAIGWWSEEWSRYFIDANVMIACFNLLPILPLDGGRIVQALSSRWLSFHHTLVAGAWLSMGSSCALAVYAFYPVLYNRGLDLNILMLALFLFYTNWMERKHVPYRFVRFLMNRAKRLRGWETTGRIGTPIMIGVGGSVAQVLKRMRRDSYHMIYVMGNDGRISQIIPEQLLIDAYFTKQKIEDHRDPPTASD